MGITININANEVYVHTAERPEIKEGGFFGAEEIAEKTEEDYLDDFFNFCNPRGINEAKPGDLTADEEMFLEGRAEAELSVGDIVKLNFFGKPTEFRVVHKNYKTEGKVVLMPEDILLFHVFNRKIDNKYTSSDMREYLNNVVLRGFHPMIQNAIAQTPVECADGYEDKKTIINDKIWLPSWTEMGFSGIDYAREEGSRFEYFSSNEKRKKKGSSFENWYWLRTRDSGCDTHAWYVYADGTANYIYVTLSLGVVPAFEI